MKLYSSHLQKSAAKEGDEQLMVEMNTTSLIDVMLVLLVMLIITIPVQLHSVPLDMPSSRSVATPAVVSLEVDAQGFVRWDGELISEVAVLDGKLKAAASQAEQPEIHIRPEPTAAYALVVALIAQAQQQGLSKVGVVN